MRVAGSAVIDRREKSDRYKDTASTTNQPDYKTMKTLISAIQKQVIKDVVVYVENKRNER